MATWRSRAIVPGSPADVLELLTDPEAIARWAPVPFEVLALDGRRLRAVRYLLRPAMNGSEIDASVRVEGKGLWGRVVAKATEGLLAAGAPRLSLKRLAHELEPAFAA